MNSVGAFPTQRRAALPRPGCSDKYARVARSSPGSDASSRPPRVASSKQGAPSCRPGVVINANGLPHYGRMRLKKLVQGKGGELRFGSWNIGTLTGRLAELVEVMTRRRINIMCLQETKWVGAKAREIAPWGYKLWYSGTTRSKNGVGIVVDREHVDDVVEVFRKNDRIMSIKLVMGDESLTVVSAYAPQVGLDAALRQQFWEDLEEVVQRVPIGEQLIIGGDLNGHVGSGRDGFESVHGGFGMGNRNEAGSGIMEFAQAYDLSIMNTWFKKQESHLVTYRSGERATQIDYFLVRRARRTSYKDCKVIPGESAVTQHRLLVLDFRKTKVWRRRRPVGEARIKWWKLVGENQNAFVEKLESGAIWMGAAEEGVDTWWDKMEYKIKEVAKEVLGEATGRVPVGKDPSWWNDEVKQAIKNKRECYRRLGKDRTTEAFEKYKEARQEAKNAVRDARAKVNGDLYAKLDTKEGEKDIYRLARLRDKRTHDVRSIKCIKDGDQKVLVKEHEVKDRWRSYFNNLFNDDQAGDVGDLSLAESMVNRSFMRRIQVREVKDALKKMKLKKATGPDGIPIEVWRCLGDKGIKWLTSLFKKIWTCNKMPTAWRKSTIVPLYKNKGDVQECTNYRAIKLMSHTMKLWERVIEQRLRRTVTISENQFGFMPGRSTMEAIHLLRQMVEQHRDHKKDLHMVFIDLEKAYDKVPREVLWWTMAQKQIPRKYIDIIKDMYDGVTTNVRTSVGSTEDFPITMGVHQGSALSPFLFAIVLDELTKSIQDEVPRCMMFADDIVLIEETREDVEAKLELWRQTLECRGFRLSRSKTEYMECHFSGSTRDGGVGVITLDGKEISSTDCFRYLGSIIQRNGELDEDVAHRIKAGWTKWRGASGFLCDRGMPLKLKGKFYRTAIRPALMYGTECWAIKQGHSHKMSVAEMRMLRWMCGHTRIDRVRNDDIRKKLGVAAIEDKLMESRLRWFGHICRRPSEAPVRRLEAGMDTRIVRGRGRPRQTWGRVIESDMRVLGLRKEMTLERGLWRDLIRVEDCF